MTTVPKYTINKPTYSTVDLSFKTNDEGMEIALDLNKKGFAVYIDDFAPNNIGGFFFFNNNLFDMDNKGNVSLHNGAIEHEEYINGEWRFIIVPLTVAQKKQLAELMKPPVVIGKFNDKDVQVTGDKITIGCQHSTKDEVVALAKAILKHYKVNG